MATPEEHRNKSIILEYALRNKKFIKVSTLKRLLTCLHSVHIKFFNNIFIVHRDKGGPGKMSTFYINILTNIYIYKIC